MVVGDYALLTIFFKFHNVAQLLCNCCPSGIGQIVELPNQSQHSLVIDRHGHPVV